MTIFNLNRFTWADPVRRVGHYIEASPFRYFMLTLVIPVAIYLLLVKFLGREEPKEKESEALAEKAMRDEGSGELDSEFS